MKYANNILETIGNTPLVRFSGTGFGKGGNFQSGELCEGQNGSEND